MSLFYHEVHFARPLPPRGFCPRGDLSCRDTYSVRVEAQRQQSHLCLQNKRASPRLLQTGLTSGRNCAWEERTDVSVSKKMSETSAEGGEGDRRRNSAPTKGSNELNREPLRGLPEVNSYTEDQGPSSPIQMHKVCPLASGRDTPHLKSVPTA